MLKVNLNFQKKNIGSIDVSVLAVQPYIYTLIANETSPYDFHKNLEMYASVRKYGKYVFYSEEVDERRIYIFSTREDAIKEKLLEQKFIKEKYKELEIWYKPIEH